MAREQDVPVAVLCLEHKLDAGCPLAWRIGWSGGGGHFAVIEGYRTNGGPWVAVDDLRYGASDLALSTLRSPSA